MFHPKRLRVTGARLLLLLCLMVWGVSFAHAGSFIVIANKSVVESTLTRVELQGIFLGEKVKWGNRKHIKMAVLEDDRTLKEFLQVILGKTPSQFDQHWVRMVTTGKASMPPAFPDGQQMIDFVARTPNAIGFVPAGQAGDAVKTIAIK
ncbi:hypothetical protein [Geomonas subterranea]|uniref:Phosphate ABC transporter substrate-binding protein n=1 Tax=Geomonas subterranea TaxID=2847989 RepID=A0ABX8LKB7_9BACT|nr:MULTISPECIES: hypothetical protein [Geomonas]QXE90000.1 hypothetical protein KP001_16470 [Geomonas subterranea]QXM07880.1 hypothetical protein KP002_12810 [Geomonas subterranea]